MEPRVGIGPSRADVSLPPNSSVRRRGVAARSTPHESENKGRIGNAIHNSVEDFFSVTCCHLQPFAAKIIAYSEMYTRGRNSVMSEQIDNSKKHPGGPKTPEGKRRSSLNSMRHGLTAQTIVLPE